MKFYSFFILIIINCASHYGSPTAKKCVFMYYRYELSGAVVDTLARYYDLVVLPDKKREINPSLRQKGLLYRRKAPLVFVYKDCATISGPIRGRKSPESAVGGGVTIGGFWHFDSLFWGYGAYDPDTVFLMGSNQTGHRDSLGRVQAGSGSSYEWRWAMNWGNQYWTDFFACTSKVQCLRNHKNVQYDNTYFDGVFLDNILHFNRQYSIYPQQYWVTSDTAKNDSLMRQAVYGFLQRIYDEYHDVATPTSYPHRILALGNTNIAFKRDGLWENCLKRLDGGMEESFAQT